VVLTSCQIRQRDLRWDNTASNSIVARPAEVESELTFCGCMMGYEFINSASLLFSLAFKLGTEDLTNPFLN